MVSKKTTPQKDETPAKSVDEIIGSPKENVSVKPEPSVIPAQALPIQPAPIYPQPVSSFGYRQEPTVTVDVSGILDIQPEGHGFLRPKFIPSQRDVYISQSQIRRFMLRPGDLIKGVGRPPKDTERYFGLLKVETVNDMPADSSLNRPYFDDLTAVYPKKQITLSTGKLPLSTRMIDLISPIGFGQRGMIVSPPKAGKTTILKEIAAGIAQNYPKAHLMAALIGERPEEVTDIAQSVKGDVVASHFDEPPDAQTRVAEITLERARRLVEMGTDVIILLDSITRLARAYNLSVAPSGRTLSGGFDPAALWPAKKFFGAARNCQEGGSLTIIGTALVDTGSRMDDLIYEEFKGTGNLELHLDRRLADRRIFPSIDIARSGTRQEELLLSEKDLKKVSTMRRMIDMLGPEERTSIFVERLSKTATNEEFLESLGKG
ncbi:MAG: transcription termination factor Rho [Candidatus Levybacteria bacterium]|nr:transcription termination factor Rho [Candidatus Levybacteria bacterium]